MTRTTITEDELIELLEDTMSRVAEVAPALPIEPVRPSRWPVTAAAATIAVVGVGGIALLVDRPNGAGQPTAQQPPVATAAPVDTAAPQGTAPIDATDNGQPRWASGTDPAMFPSTVPMPEDAETVTAMEWDGLRVGWEFAGRRHRTAGVDRCARYGEAFDETWTSTPDTDEHESVLFAHHYTSDSWDVGIYCTERGDFLVQVLSLDATSAEPPPSG